MSLLDCPVCLERIEEPQVLPTCGHSLCRGCTQRVAATAHWGFASCPVCRQRFRPGEVRPNFTLQGLLAEYESAEAPEPGPGHPGAALVRDVESGARLKAGRQKQLEFLGLPPKLAATVAEEDRSIGLRLFLLDNSGSTAAYDGKTLETLPDGRVQVQPRTRWEEIKRLALDHAEWNSLLGTPCEFVLLNPRHRTPQQGVDFVRVDAHLASAKPQIEALKRMLDMAGPGGPTPITARIQEICQRVQREKSALMAAGQRVVLVIATDGLPTGSTKQQLVQVLRGFMRDLPVTTVVRLCTDDQGVAEFYNEVERDLEMPLDVLDDLLGEAREIAAQGNGWFVYTQALHRLREGGTFVKIFDMLDERRLTAAEAALLAQLLLRREGQGPFAWDPEDFCEEIQDVLEEVDPVYCVRQRCMVSPVDAWGLRCAVLGFWSSCADKLRTTLGPTLLQALCHNTSAGCKGDPREYVA